MAAMGLDLGEWEAVAYRMMAGKELTSPFTPEQVSKGTEYLPDWVTKMGCPPTPADKDIPQGPQVRLIQAYLRVCGDPDAEALD